MINSHEENKKPIEKYFLWIDLLETINSRKLIDKDIQVSFNTENEKWTKFLRVLVDIISFLAENNLQFKATHSTIDYDGCELFISKTSRV